mmetsp:Transcript_46305/g.116129  ORF Transcript_46305/g.116129 Transcript_46305/m.116129 type:complete len:80 (+) Transcript_46305:219-458(+)
MRQGVSMTLLENESMANLRYLGEGGEPAVELPGSALKRTTFPVRLKGRFVMVFARLKGVIEREIGDDCGDDSRTLERGD